MIILPLLLSLTVAQDTTFLDARARELYMGARARMDVADLSITHYKALAKERISMGLNTRLRDRLFYRRETASRIDWRRGGPVNITVLGAREAVPIATSKIVVPGDLKSYLPRLAFDPLDSEVLFTVNDSSDVMHPLSSRAQLHYQFRTGDSTIINLADRSIKLIELKVIPRRAVWTLVTGSFWLESETKSPVQLFFRLAKEIDFDNDIKDDEGEDATIPFFLKPMRADVNYFTIEYGLVHLRWWLPRLFAAEGFFQMGPIKTPLVYERSYSDYEVTADTTRAPISRAALGDSIKALRMCRPLSGMQVGIALESDKPSEKDLERRRAQRARADSIQRAELAKDTARARRMAERQECSKLFHVVVADSSQLLNSSELPPNIYGDKEELTSDPELQRIADQLRKLADPPWQVRTPKFLGPLASNGLIRYNKIEALSVGARTEFDFGQLRGDATGRLGVADLEPRFEVGLTRESLSRSMRLAGYRRLEVMDKPSGFGTMSSSFGALLFGRDERDYYNTLGGELLIHPSETRSRWYTLRLFGEQQRSVQNETNFSLRKLTDSGFVFDPNLLADRADQVGAGLTLRHMFGQNPGRPRLGVELTGEASSGTFEFTRESATLLLNTPLAFGLAGAVEVAAGTTTGDVPMQSNWFLGGVRTLRGYSIGDASGTAFWRARGEIGRGIPLARVVLFTDVGWAGSRDDIQRKASMLSVGAGASFMDGMLRLDLARSLRGKKDWRIYLSVDGIL